MIDAEIQRAIEAHDTESFEQLISNCGALETTLVNVDTPLHYAAWQGFEYGVRRLLDLGGQVDAIGDGGKTPLMYACLHGHSRVAETLLRAGAKVDAKDDSGGSSLSYAYASAKPRELVALLLQSGATQTVRQVVEGGNVELLRAMLDHDRECVRETGGSAALVSRAIRHADTALLKACNSRDRECIEQHLESASALFELLVSAGADVSGDAAGRSPMHVAVQLPHEYFVERLLELGVDPGPKERRMSPYYIAQRNPIGEKIVRLLEEHDSSRN